MLPKPESVAVIVDVTAMEFTGLTVERNPAQVLFSRPEPDSLMLFDFPKTLMGYRLNRLRVDFKKCGGAFGQELEVVFTRVKPGFLPFPADDFVTKVPDKVTVPGQHFQLFPFGTVLKSEPVSQ